MAPQQPEQPDLSPAQDRVVRDLLAGARHTGPLPDDVAARLDATLADLAAARTAGPAPSSTPADESSEGAPDATVVPLASRRRRRIGLGLVAAAAVVAGGVAVTQVLPQMSGEDAATSSEAGGASSLDAGGAGQQEDGVGALSRPPRLSPGTFRRDVLRARGLVGKGVLDTSATSSDATPDAPPDAQDAQGVEGQAGGETEAENGGEAERDRRSAGRAPELAPRLLADRCGIDAGPGRLVVVRYAGQRALLVLRPPAGDRQRADLFPCGAAEPLRSAVLPVR